MGASGQTLYLKMEQNCIVYERSVKLQDIASVECTDVGIRRQVLQEQIYHFQGKKKSSFVQVFSVLYIIRKIHEKYQRVEAGAYLRVCEILEKSIYGQQNLEPYEMRTVSAFMKKLEAIGDNTLNRRERIELRYGYVVRIMEKIRRKTGQKGKTKKNSRKELTK